ncbi:peptidylprolyl isomerase domain and WD repeat-containing protein 1-like [Lingula anatina]|uniref:peptidylprolyl isomerase n=1 Tax=Lingula anatina TaxID=7574 RepID=A0A1S3IZN1_LINAN|nr:peptidylprolyl isomerase domain and WD repeat-containing protein 1-like [Lingula anatina]|eukprot:XP_013403657.1 peptidylprolyl isomerase domain and WD repeat-containing protein 1-like [Lingula anatina]
MINMLKLSYVPHCCSWIYAAGDAVPALAVSEKGNKIYIYDGRGSDVPIETLEKIHYKQVVVIKYNPVYEVAVSADESGMVEYWTGPKSDYNFPKNVSWEYKTDTDLYEFAKCQTVPTGVTFSPNGKLMATIAKDRKVRIFKFATGKLYKVLDESLKTFTELQQTRQQLPNMEFGRRMAVERDLEKSDAFSRCNVLFDSSGNFIMYGTMLGIKVINLYTNQCVRFIGKPENIRFVHLSLFQGSVKGTKAALSAEMEASDNPSLQEVKSDPTLFCTAFKKNRFYMFTRREPDSKSADAERDIFNERPSKEDIVAATQDASYTRVASTAVIYTTMGDIHIKLFPKECPKTVENFCVHSRNGYYNGHIFHRVIKGFMIQTGDPLGIGGCGF